MSVELELELIQTQMAQKPMLRAEVYAHAMRASQNRKKSTILSSLYALPFYDFDLRASHARTLLPAALASVPFGFVLVRVRVRGTDR